MKRRISAVVLAATVAASCGSASAAVVNYSAVIDLDASMFQSGGKLLVPLPGGPISIAVGDTLEGTISFANEGRITVFDGTVDGQERIFGTFQPDIGTTAFSVGSLGLLGVQGDYLGPTTITSLPVGGAIGFAGRSNLTDTSFSFSGVSFSLTYVDEHTEEDFPLTAHVTPWGLTFPFEPTGISEGGTAVPEPATWATLMLGLGLLGSTLRRRRAKMSACASVR